MEGPVRFHSRIGPTGSGLRVAREMGAKKTDELGGKSEFGIGMRWSKD